MNTKTASLTLALVLVLGASGLPVSAIAQQALTQPQVESQLVDKGYTKVHDVKFDDGMWQARARSADGKRVRVHIDAKTGQIYPENQVSNLSERDVRAALETQGYTRVHDVEFDDGLWQAKAENPAGKRVKLKVDPVEGKVIGTD